MSGVWRDTDIVELLTAGGAMSGVWGATDIVQI